MWRCLVIILIIGSGCSNEPKPAKSKIIIEGVSKPPTENNIKLKELYGQFNSRQTSGRNHILYELNELKHPEIKTILENALFDENENVRIIAIQSIKDNRQVESIDRLIELFKQTKNHTLVSNLTRTFVAFQLRDPIPAIVEKLNSENEMIVYNCIWALGEIGNDSEIKILQQFASNSNVPKVYDDDGFLSQTTQFSIGEMAEKSIALIKTK